MNFLCESCNSDLKEVGVYSSKPTMFVYDEETQRFEPLIDGDDFKVYCCNCGNIVDDSKMHFKF